MTLELNDPALATNAEEYNARLYDGFAQLSPVVGVSGDIEFDIIKIQVRLVFMNAVGQPESLWSPGISTRVPPLPEWSFRPSRLDRIKEVEVLSVRIADAADDLLILR